MAVSPAGENAPARRVHPQQSAWTIHRRATACGLAWRHCQPEPLEAHSLKDHEVLAAAGPGSIAAAPLDSRRKGGDHGGDREQVGDGIPFRDRVDGISFAVHPEVTEAVRLGTSGRIRAGDGVRERHVGR